MNETSPPATPIRAPDAAAALEAIRRTVEDAHRSSAVADPAGDAQIAVVVHDGQVAGVHPAGRVDGLRG
ncbi:hypothetical protein ABZZ01_24030, partial [Streptomyces virginiae]